MRLYRLTGIGFSFIFVGVISYAILKLSLSLGCTLEKIMSVQTCHTGLNFFILSTDKQSSSQEIVFLLLNLIS
jgi:hypothetical protein